MLDAGDYLERRRQELGLDRADDLAHVQNVLERWYPGQVRAKSLNNGVLKLVTPSAAVAGELRLRQVELLGELQNHEVKRVVVTIAMLS